MRLFSHVAPPEKSARAFSTLTQTHILIGHMATIGCRTETAMQAERVTRIAFLMLARIYADPEFPSYIVDGLASRSSAPQMLCSCLGPTGSDTEETGVRRFGV